VEHPGCALECHGTPGIPTGGEPGIGKTRLAGACAGQLAEDGFGFAWVSCPEGDGAPPFWAWDHLLDQLGGPTSALLAELSATTGLGGRPRAAGSPAERMRKAVTTAFVTRSRGWPTRIPSSAGTCGRRCGPAPGAATRPSIASTGGDSDLDSRREPRTSALEV
jgi:hypothetical protein